MPFSTEAGQYDDIVISVSDGVNSANLAAFSIQVRESVELRLTGDAELVSSPGENYFFNHNFLFPPILRQAVSPMRLRINPRGWTLILPRGS